MINDLSAFGEYSKMLTFFAQHFTVSQVVACSVSYVSHYGAEFSAPNKAPKHIHHLENSPAACTRWPYDDYQTVSFHLI